MRILAIDPGNEESAWLVYDVEGGLPLRWAKMENEDVRDRVIGLTTADLLAVEMIASYGMPVGKEVFDTCVWIGRFLERWEARLGPAVPPIRLIYRREVRAQLCGSQKAGDSNVRQALIDRYGPGRERAIGVKASPGPLYGMKADCWAALGVAITAAEMPQKDDDPKAGPSHNSVPGASPASIWPAVDGTVRA